MMKLIVTITFYYGHIDDLGPIKGRIVVDLLELPWKEWPVEMPNRVDFGLPRSENEPSRNLDI